ncbi:hypothetical protein CapIbe_001612 [Capra ibex]
METRLMWKVERVCVQAAARRLQKISHHLSTPCQCLNLIPEEQRRGFTLDDKRGGERPALPGLRAPAMTVSARRHLEQVPTPRVTPQWASCLDLGILTLRHLLLQRCPLVPLSLICAGWSYTLLTRDFTLGQVCPGLGLKQIKEDAENREQLSWGKGEEERRLIQRSLRDPAPPAPAGTRGPGFGHPPAPPAKSSVIPLKAGLKSVSLSRDQHRPQMLLVPSVLPHRFHQGALHPPGRNKVS